MANWTAKEPDSVLDYVYRIPLDAGDSIAAKANVTFEKLSGDVAIESYDIAAAADTTTEGYGQDVTVWLSGGTAGETAVFRIGWTTVATRINDDAITLPVFESDLVPLVLSGYAKPVAAHLLQRYPAFASVDAGTVQYWLTDAERYVTDAWGEGDYAAGLMALAAHNMTLAGYGSLELGFTDAAANARMAGGYGSTRYGAEYQALLRANRGGPLVAPTGVAPDGVYPGVWP
jgi:hypothetical protein